MSEIPEVTFEHWLMAQSHRDDLVGTLVRLWLQEPGTKLAAWIEARRTDGVLAEHISQAESEYRDSLQALALGQSSPTLPKLFAREGFEEFTDEVLEFHHKHPEVSANKYLHGLHVEFREHVESRTVVYIDTCHWIKLRHIILDDQKQQPVYAGILGLLENLREQRKIICPISFPLFAELMRQSDPETRDATAWLMDHFSDGVCLQNPEHLTRIELQRIVFGRVFGERAKDLAAWIWTKVGFLAGERLPTNDVRDEKSTTLIQKTFIDMMWAMQLADCVDEVSREGFRQRDYAEFAEAYNRDAQHYRKEKLSFDQILEREKAFLFRQVMEEWETITKDIFQRYPDECAEYMKRDDPQQGPDSFLLPSLQIRAGIHASYFSSPQNFKPNDLIDAEHAALALPYCDLFFCEGPLAHRLTTKPLVFDQEYGTKVIRSPEVFADELKQLLDRVGVISTRSTM